MKQTAGILSIILILFGSVWGSSSTSLLLTEEQIVSVLVDMELAEAAVHHYTKDKQAAASFLQANRLLICKAHDVELKTFQDSYNYYMKDLQVLQRIYEEVVNQLKILKERAGDEKS